jgi:hypothetical protein
MKYVYEALPFIASIIIKILDRFYGNAIADQIVQSIPYGLTEGDKSATDAKKQEERKYTVADIAGDAHLRTTYMITLCLSIVSTVALTGKSGMTAPGLLGIAALAMLLAVSFPVLTKRLGWMNVKLEKSRLRRSDVTMIILIIVDLGLMIFSLAALYEDSLNTLNRPRH